MKIRNLVGWILCLAILACASLTQAASKTVKSAGGDYTSIGAALAAYGGASGWGNDAGADPVTVADALVEAVRSGRFWVLPQPELAYAVLDRAQRIADGREPVDLLG